MATFPQAKWGEQTSDDGRSRPFGATDARTIIATVEARYDGWAEIRPGHWAVAGAIVNALRAERFSLQRKPSKRKPSLRDDLDELERTNPDVAAAADDWDQFRRRFVERHAAPANEDEAG